LFTKLTGLAAQNTAASQPAVSELEKFKSSGVSGVSRYTKIYLPLLLEAAVNTLWVSLASMAVAMLLGLGLAVVNVYSLPPLSWLARTYIELFRGTPLLIQLWMIYYGLPGLGLNLSPAVAAVVGLGLNYAAYEAENYRAGLQAIPRGQIEAALS